jgi:hypothetical protein
MEPPQPTHLVTIVVVDCQPNKTVYAYTPDWGFQSKLAGVVVEARC